MARGYDNDVHITGMVANAERRRHRWVIVACAAIGLGVALFVRSQIG